MVKNNAYCPSYKLLSERDRRMGRYTNAEFQKSIQSVPFVLKSDKPYLTIALTVSFGFTRNNKDVYPIAAIGESLHEVEDCLKVNLILEKIKYEKYRLMMPKQIMDDNFLEANSIGNYILNLHSLPRYISYLQEVSKNRKFIYFKTPQFYKIDKGAPKYFPNLTLLESIKKNNKLAVKKRISIYKKELKNVSEITSIKQIRGKKIDFTKILTNSLLLKSYSLSSYFSKQQLEILSEIENNLYSFITFLRNTL